MGVTQHRKYGTKTVPKLLEKVNIIDIVNDVTVGGTGVPLSAEAGKQLKSSILAEATTRSQSILDVIGTATVDYNTLGKIENQINSLSGSTSTALADAVALLETADENEIAARISADDAIILTASQNKTALETLVSNEAAARTAADTILTDDLAQEVLDRQTAISNEATTRANAVSSETSRAEAAELVNANNIVAETTRATTAETNLQTAISAEQTRAEGVEGSLQTALANETANRISSDQGHENRLAAIESGLVAGIVWRASLADMVALDALVEADQQAGWAYYVGAEKDVYIVVNTPDGDYRPAGWTGVDVNAKSFLKFADFAEVTGMINAEKTRAITAESELQGNLSTETSRATTAENTITTNLGNEVTRATGAENALASRLDVVEGLDSVAGSIAYAVKGEKTRAVAEETRIEGLVSQEVTDRGTAVTNERTRAVSEEARIEGLVTQEVTDRTTAVSAETTRATNAESLLTSNLSAEVSNRQTAVADEATARTSADNALSGRLDIVEGADTVTGSILNAVKQAKQETYDNILVPRVEGIGGTLLVVGDTVTVNHAVADGVNGVVFGEVIVYAGDNDQEAVAVNVASVSGSQITLAVSVVNEFDGKSVKVSYFTRALLDTGAGTGVAGSGLAGA